MSKASADTFTAGKKLLQRPVLPLVRLVQLLYLTGPFATVSELLPELTDPIETSGILYDAPQTELQPYLDILTVYNDLKNPCHHPWTIQNEQGEAVDGFEALDLWVAQQILTRELEKINSLLCGPCGCDLCCIGPTGGLADDFFEIPLRDAEIHLFDLPVMNTAISQKYTADSEPPLMGAAGKPFYQMPSAIYHWRDGWSLILPRNSRCPGHDPGKKICRIYASRPDVCRRPQIFPYVLEPTDGQADTFVRRRTLLAIWDCPYVKKLQQEIGAYAQFCELEPVFKKNKK